MLYAILAYHRAGVVESWSREERDALIEDLHVVHRELTDEGIMGPAAGLDATRTAVTLRDGVVMDGPFAETKEDLLGFYVLDCADRDAAIAAARALQRVNVSAVYEIREVRLSLPGKPLPALDI